MVYVISVSYWLITLDALSARIAAINRIDWMPWSHHRICSEHFREACDLHIMGGVEGPAGTANAVP